MVVFTQIDYGEFLQVFLCDSGGILLWAVAGPRAHWKIINFVLHSINWYNEYNVNKRIKQSKALASRQAAGAINVEPNYKDNKLTTNDETYTINVHLFSFCIIYYIFFILIALAHVYRWSGVHAHTCASAASFQSLLFVTAPQGTTAIMVYKESFW